MSSTLRTAASGSTGCMTPIGITRSHFQITWSAEKRYGLPALFRLTSSATVAAVRCCTPAQHANRALDEMSTSRHTACTMQKHDPTPSNAAPRQIVGLSLSPEVAAELKMEAARRGLSLRKLFLEMWTLYKKTPT